MNAPVRKVTSMLGRTCLALTIISRVKAMPNSTCYERGYRTTKPWLLTLRCNAKINVIFQPFVRVHVPGIENPFAILTEFNSEGVDVSHTIPTWPLSLIKSIEA